MDKFDKQITCGNCAHMKVGWHLTDKNERKIGIMCYKRRKTYKERVWPVGKDLMVDHWRKKARKCKDFKSMGKL